MTAATRQFETLFAYAPELEPLLADEAATEIMLVPGASGEYGIVVEREGRMERQTGANGLDTVLLLAAAQALAAELLERDIDEKQPVLSATLGDGSRITIVVPPASDGGVAICIRKHRAAAWTLADLIANGSFPKEIGATVEAAIWLRQNFLISGSPGTGKTVLLNALAGEYIPPDRRVIVVEDEVREVQLPRHANKHFLRAGENVSVADLIRISLRMKPQHLIVGEVLGAEAFQLLKAFNLGLSGSFCTLHADSAPEALDRLSTAVVEANTSMTYESIRLRIAQSIHYVLHMEQRLDGRRVVASLVRVDGYDRAADRFECKPLYSEVAE